MHVGLITPEYPHIRFNGNLGGIATFTKNLAEQLINENIRVSVFIPSQSEEFIDNVNGVQVYFVKRKVRTGFTWYTNRKYFNKYVNNIIENNKISVIEAPDWTGFTAFMKFSCPLVIRLHGSDTYFCDLEKRKVKTKNKYFEKKALLGANKIVGVSNFVSQKTKELFSLKKEIATIYNTINIQDFIPNHDNVEKNTLLYFGTIIRKKGVLEIAKAFNKVIKQNKTIKLCLLGRDCNDIFTGSSTLKLFKSSLSDQAVLNFKYIEAVPYAEVKQFISRAEVIVLPSFAEAFPLTWLEAMAMEKKIVTSNIGWAKEIMVNGETGFTVNPKDTTKFADKILTLLENKEKANFMALAARLYLKNNFNSKNILNQNIDLYKSCVENEI